MRKIIATMWTTADGFVAGPADEMEWVRLDEQMMEYEQALVEQADILMLGRITFDDFAGYWSPLANEVEPRTGVLSKVDDMQRAYARRIDEMKKIAVSASGDVALWRNSETMPSINEIDIGRLKREDGGDIVIYGSISVINALSALGLIDEYHLLLHPIALGKGRPLFGNDSPINLELETVDPFQSGVVLVKYKVRKRATPVELK